MGFLETEYDGCEEPLAISGNSLQINPFMEGERAQSFIDMDTRTFDDTSRHSIK